MLPAADDSRRSALRDSRFALVPVLLPALLLDTAFALDLAGRLLDSAWLWTAGAWLGAVGAAAGLLAGLPAGVLGSRARGGRTARFAVLYGSGVALFAVARWVRGDASIPPEAVLVAAEGIGALLVYAGGWAGGWLGERGRAGDEAPPGRGPLRESSGRAGRGAR